jgi:protein-tyrosine kinase
VSQQYSALFSQLVPAVTEGPALLLILASIAPGTGTTTALLNLAISGCRQHQRRIVVVDANRDRPAAAVRLGMQSGVGLQEVLEGKAALEQAVLPTPLNELYLVAPGTKGNNATVWPADALRWVLAWLRERFDLVLVDGAAWENPELRTLAPLADGVYLVLDSNDVSKPQVRAVTRGILQIGGKVGGLIVR